MEPWGMVVAFAWALAYGWRYMTTYQANDQIHVLPAYVSREFTEFNERVFELGRHHSKLLKLWFLVGSIVALIGMIGGTMYLLWTAFVCVARIFGHVEVEAPLSTSSVMIPGVTMPIYSVGYLWIAIFISVAFHEFGHALAAALCEIRMASVGIFFAVIFPGAYVRFDSYCNISIPDQIKIQSAGIWHNAVLVLFCALQIALVPTLLSPWYHLNHGVTVISLPEYSVFQGILAPGDVIISLDHQATLNMDQWLDGIDHLTRTMEIDLSLKGIGYCIDPALVSMNPNEVATCCRNDTDSLLQCFSYQIEHEWKQVCLDGKQIGEASHSACTSDTDCGDQVCLVPSQQDLSTLIRLELQDHRSVMIYGYPPDIYAELELSGYTFRGASTRNQFLLQLPTRLERLWHFVCNLSGSLGFFNALPIHFLDGGHLCASYLELMVQDDKLRSKLLSRLLAFGDILLVSVAVLTIAQSWMY